MAAVLNPLEDSENAKAMMPEYHIGTLDDTSRVLLAQGEMHLANSQEPRPSFLQSKVWSRAILSAKKRLSADTKIFTFELEHAAQTVGIPVGQHLLMRLRDPVTREAIIRAYTPISDLEEQGKLHVLVKVYYNTPERKGGKMTQALDAIPVGHFVDFKGPMGRFEYLGRGLCSIAGIRRKVRRFIMICAGSGITPIFQVLRAVLKDRVDTTQCLVLDGNRGEGDILCRRELDAMATGNEHKCRLLYALSRPETAWKGPRGRMGRELFEKEIGRCQSVNGEDLVLVCGPEPLEQSVRSILTDMGWKEDDLLFF